MPKVYGYVRVSSNEQNEIRQVLALRDAGVEKRNIFVDRDGSTVFAFHEVTDQHVMHLMASLVLKMAEKCEADPKAIIGALDTIITEHVNG